MATVGDCHLLGDRKGGVAWYRLKNLHDPAGLTFTANKILDMLDVSQDGCDAQTHMLRMDAAIAEALRPFLQPGGGYDWRLFGQVALASNYFRSFHPDVRDAA